MLDVLFNTFVTSVFGNYLIFTFIFIGGVSAIMMLLNIPAVFIVALIGLIIVAFNVFFGGAVLGVLTGIIALMLGIKIATAIYSLFKPSV